MEAKQSEKTAAEEEKDATTGEKEEADKALGVAMESKTLEEAALADDQLYLKDLTMQCELKAREFDQQSKMRADEVVALESAMKIVKEKVKDNADDANKRALVQVSKMPSPAKEESFADQAAEELEEADEE